MTDKCYECGGPAPEGWEMCPVCSVRAKLPDRPDELPAPEGEQIMQGVVIAVPTRVEHHEAPAALLEKVHMVFRNGTLVQPGEHNDYTLDRARSRVKWSVPLEEWEQVCIFCPADGARWAWSPQCGVFVDIRR